MTTVTDSTFEGLAFPVINVRLANHKARASLSRYSETMRKTMNYTYDQPDGGRFALKAARALWDSIPREDWENDSVVLIPGNVADGYAFTVVPSRFLEGDN